MHLVAPLAAGVAGAENGIAEIYERGTTARVAYYPSFEGDTSALYADIMLDSHGGAVVYTSQLCRVIVKTSGGAILRDFTAGDADHSVEVRSNSFTGTDYGSGSSAVGMPTTLAEVLDRWTIFNGGTDWQVAVPGGGQLPISSAIAGSYGLVFNVKAYGAVGDGIADDTGAINSAIATAVAGGGGIVYLPPGSYRTMGDHSISGKVSLLGAGTATVLVLDNAAAATLFLSTTGAAPTCWQTIVNMSIRGSHVLPFPRVIHMQADCQVACSNLYIDGTNFNVGALIGADVGPLSQFLMSACTFKLSSASRVIDMPSSNFRRLMLRDCRFITPASYGNSTIIDANLFDIQACVWDNTLTTSGTYLCVRSSSSTLNWRISGCRFSDAAGATVTALGLGTYAANSSVVESDNLFGASITAYQYVVSGASRGAQVQLKTRESRTLFMVDNSSAAVVPTGQYGQIVLSSTWGGVLTIQGLGTPPDGARGTIHLYRPAGSANVTALLGGSNFLNPVGVPTVASGTYTWEYRSCIPNATACMALVVDGRNNGTAA